MIIKVCLAIIIICTIINIIIIYHRNEEIIMSELVQFILLICFAIFVITFLGRGK